MTIDSLFTVAVQYGLPTILLFVVGLAYWKKDQAFAAEQRARIDDAKIFYERMAKAQDTLGEIATKFSDESAIRELTRELITAIQNLNTLVEDMKEHDRVDRIRGPSRTGGGPNV